MSEYSDKARAIAAKFDSQWGPFTKALAGHPKTALAIGAAAGAGIVLALAIFVF